MKSIDRSRRRLTVFSLFLLLLIFHVYSEESRAFPLSVEEETILGQEFLAKIRKTLVFVADDFTHEYINDLGQYLPRPLETGYFSFRFYLVKDGNLNAFAAPASHIFVYSGLVQVMEEIDALAAVISHEIAHVSERHLAQRDATRSQETWGGP